MERILKRSWPDRGAVLPLYWEVLTKTDEKPNLLYLAS